MDKISIESFEEETIYFWFCPKCEHQNEECTVLEELKDVKCASCRETYEIER